MYRNTRTSWMVVGSMLLLVIVSTRHVQAGAEFRHNSFTFGSVFLQDVGTGITQNDNFLGDVGTTSVTINEPGIAGSAEAYWTPTSCGASLSVVGSNGHAQIVCASYEARVTRTTDVLIEWDTANTSTSFFEDTFIGAVVIYDLASEVDVFQPAVHTAGSTIVTLQSGVDYLIDVRMTLELTEPGAYADLYGRFTIIPAPGAASLLGFAGLMTRPRRRGF